MYVNHRNFRVFYEIGVEEHDGDDRFGDVRSKSGSGNMAVSCMRNASIHNYRNSPLIVDLAMGQIPRFSLSDNVLSSCCNCNPLNDSKLLYQRMN